MKTYVFILSKKSIIYVIIAAILVIGIFVMTQFGKKTITTATSFIWKNNFKNINIQNAKIAIVIDDFGNNGNGTQEMLSIDRPITCAIIPFLEYSQKEAILAYEAGHEVIIHIPMEPKKGNPKWLGEKGITSNLTKEQIQEIVLEAIDELPYAVGVNNHMGSKITENKQIMEWIVEILKGKNLYIIDSKTSMNSVVREIAEKMQVPVLERTIFLDNEKSQSAIEKQLKKLGEIALKEGSAIAIGHVGPEGGVITANAIKKMIPILEEMGIHIVPASELLKKSAGQVR